MYRGLDNSGSVIQNTTTSAKCTLWFHRRYLHCKNSLASFVPSPVKNIISSSDHQIWIFYWFFQIKLQHISSIVNLFLLHNLIIDTIPSFITLNLFRILQIIFFYFLTLIRYWDWAWELEDDTREADVLEVLLGFLYPSNSLFNFSSHLTLMHTSLYQLHFLHHRADPNKVVQKCIFLVGSKAVAKIKSQLISLKPSQILVKFIIHSFLVLNFPTKILIL